MPVGVVLTVFVLISLAELPDKTMIANVIMGSRNRPVLVWAGASAAFFVHMVIAVAAGQALHLLPHFWIELVTTVLFAAGAAYLLFVPENAEEERGEPTGDALTARNGLRVAGTAFGVIFIGEFGDLTQILTANLAARYHDPVAVFVGAIAALVAVAALGAFGGRALLRVLPLSVIRKAGGVVLLGFTAYGVVQLVRG